MAVSTMVLAGIFYTGSYLTMDGPLRWTAFNKETSHNDDSDSRQISSISGGKLLANEKDDGNKINVKPTAERF